MNAKELTQIERRIINTLEANNKIFASEIVAILDINYQSLNASVYGLIAKGYLIDFGRVGEGQHGSLKLEYYGMNPKHGKTPHDIQVSVTIAKAKQSPFSMAATMPMGAR